MEKIACVFFIVVFSVVFCLGQSHKMIIPIKEAPNEMDNSFVIMDFHDFNLYFTPNSPIIFSFQNITDSMRALVDVDFYINNYCIYVKSIRIGYLDKTVKLSKTDSLKIAKTTFNLFQKKTFYIKYHKNINQDWTYHLRIPIVLTRRK
jgi:hypothetical protein